MNNELVALTIYNAKKIKLLKRKIVKELKELDEQLTSTEYAVSDLCEIANCADMTKHGYDEQAMDDLQKAQVKLQTLIKRLEE